MVWTNGILNNPRSGSGAVPNPALAQREADSRVGGVTTWVRLNFDDGHAALCQSQAASASA